MVIISTAFTIYDLNFLNNCKIEPTVGAKNLSRLHILPCRATLWRIGRIKEISGFTNLIPQMARNGILRVSEAAYSQLGIQYVGNFSE